MQITKKRNKLGKVLIFIDMIVVEKCYIPIKKIHKDSHMSSVDIMNNTKLQCFKSDVYLRITSLFVT